MKFVDKWMELKKNVLSEVKQTQKNRYNIFALICGSCLQICKFSVFL